MKAKAFVALLMGTAFCLCGCQKSKVEVVNLTTEQMANPVGIDCKVPRLSWQIVSKEKDVRQEGYEILVATSLQKLRDDKGNLWDSGEVASDQSVYVPYGGKEPVSGQRLYWKVRVRTNKGTTNWSEPASFQMGLMDASEWKATWIGHEFDGDVLKGRTRLPARYLRKEFGVDKRVRQANLYICGLGTYELYLNGERVGNQELAPAPTYYDTVVVYNTHEVARYLKQGRNAIGVTLGTGRYVGMRIPGMHHFDTPRLLLQLEIIYKDGTKQMVLSDKTWKITNNGPIRTTNEFDGETYDARMDLGDWFKADYNDAAWLAADSVAAPARRIEAQNNPCITVMETLAPVGITEPEAGVYVLDMGQNMVGRLHIRVHGNAGDSIKFHFAETLKADGNIYTDNLREAETTDVYIPKDTATISWHPGFVYHGFRFVEIRGLGYKPALDDFEGQVMYDEMETIGTFESSDATLNQLHKNAYWGIRGNYRGMPTDCPQRNERLGWLGDRAMGSLGESYIFDNHALYAKWMKDIQNGQGAAGDLTDIAPHFWNLRPDDMTWPSAYPLSVKMLYEQFGDIKPLQQHYPSMKKWMNYMRDKYMTDGLMPRDNYGDWCMPPESPNLVHSKDPARQTDKTVLGTTCYYMLANVMAGFADVLNLPDDAAAWRQEAEEVKKAYNEKYFHADTDSYDNNTVTANILALRYGMVPEGHERGVFDNIVKKTVDEFGGHVSCGVLGIQQLMRGLTDYGRGDLALQIATVRTYPGWGYMIEKGATTIWELWNGDTANPSMNSGNHVMLLGDVVIWMYNYLAGIGNAPGSAGYKEVQLKPYPVKGLDYVKATYQTIYGKVLSSWKQTDDTFSWTFQIPCNATGRVCVPLRGKELKEATKKAIEKKGGKYVATEDGYAVFAFPSGKYKIEVE